MALADVRNLVRAARDVVEARRQIALAIVEATGLSPEGVELALTRHVEIDATDSDLEKLVAAAPVASKISVVLSSNVFVGALRAIAIARAGSDDVVIRPSRRDPTFARALVAAAKDPALRLDESFDVAKQSDGEVHVYGRDETIADVRAKTRVPVRGHGSGMGVAWISERASLAEAARALADDVIAFDQRGCLSPRFAIVEGDDGRSSAFADALHVELERLESTVPRGHVPTDERAAGDRYVATMTYAARALHGKAHAIGVAPAGAPLVLPPPYRHVHVAAAPSAAEARKLVAPFDKGIIAVGTDDEAAARDIAPAHARVSALGRMQRPPLDGPVDRRDGSDSR